MAREFWCPECKQWIERPSGYTMTETRKQHKADHEATEQHPDLMELDIYLESFWGEQ